VIAISDIVSELNSSSAAFALRVYVA